MEPTLLNIIFYACALLCLGSFSALFSIRWPLLNHYIWEKEAHDFIGLSFIKPPPKSIVFGRSQCTHCDHLLAWKDTIPLISFVQIKGRCRYCKHTLSARYWIIEVLFLLTCLPLLFLSSGLYQLILTTILISTLLTAAVVDYEHQLIPNECCGIAITMALLLNVGTDQLDSSVLGILCGYGVVALLRGCYLYFRKVEGIGLGDAKLLAALGAWLHINNLLTVLLYASLLGILYTALCHNKETKKISFGPFLTISGIVHFYYINL